MIAFKKDVGILHTVGKVADLDFGPDELHGDIIIKRANGNCSVKIDPSGNAVHKALIKPFLAFRKTDIVDAPLIAFHGCFKEIFEEVQRRKSS